MTYLERELELMSPSRSHEGIKKALARLLEAYAMERLLEASSQTAAVRTFLAVLRSA